MKSFNLIVLMLIGNFVFGQIDDYGSSNVYVNRNHDQVIINEYRITLEDYWALPIKSTLYNMPLNCDEGITLRPANKFFWKFGVTWIFGEDIPSSKVYVYDSLGNLNREINDAELFCFIGSKKPIFIRDTKLMSIDLATGVEEIIFEFDRTKYTFHSPRDYDGNGLPNKFDYYWGGIRGCIFSINPQNDEGYTFVIDASKKRLTFWLEGSYTNIQNGPMPSEGVIKEDY